MANTSAIWQRAAHTTYQLSSPSCSTGVISRGLTPNKNLRVLFCKKVRKMDYQHKNDQIKTARVLCRKKQVFCTSIIALLYHVPNGFISSKLT